MDFDNGFESREPGPSASGQDVGLDAKETASEYSSRRESCIPYESDVLPSPGTPATSEPEHEHKNSQVLPPMKNRDDQIPEQTARARNGSFSHAQYQMHLDAMERHQNMMPGVIGSAGSVEPSDKEGSSTISEMTMMPGLREHLFDVAKEDLFYTLTSNESPYQPKAGVLSICTVQRLELRRIQHQIAEKVTKMYRNGRAGMLWNSDAPSEDLTSILNSYCDAVRNLDFMEECASRAFDKDPFLMTTSRAVDRWILQDTGLVPHHILPSGDLPPARDAEHPTLPVAYRIPTKLFVEKSRSERIAWAATGGLSLIVPMLIMANVPGQIASQVTTCISLCIFIFLIAFLTKLGPNEMLAATTAYAAVLVVFVGTSLSSIGGLS